ncbi:dihydrofolate reductase family protein [Pseudolysinimonas yzui]|uniref:Deaminase reductase n=1 Tax=Pseudolysinimonas yzui TaxID=2708254 RepID=A0A8J3M264_9MICO|nr:dihydrofolate reductase family protein [Pseudolysinimonas yzui]GHF23830.1 deaminase reductase [Pseudolysinimonas yzui]
MSRVVSDIAVTMDGYASGVGQTLEKPFGDLDQAPLHGWMFDEPYAAENADEVAAIVDAGAFIMGRNMFGPDRGEWNLDWRGWWGDEPPYHGPVFVLAHRERAPVEMAGGTTFHFVTDGIHAALERARAEAGERNVSIAGGPATLNQYLAAGLVDELRLHVTPTIAGRGERVFEGVPAQRWEQISVRATTLVTHLVYRPAR